MTPYGIEGQNVLMSQPEKLCMTVGFSMSYLLYSMNMKWQLPNKYPHAQWNRPLRCLNQSCLTVQLSIHILSPAQVALSPAHRSHLTPSLFGWRCEQLSPVCLCLAAASKDLLLWVIVPQNTRTAFWTRASWRKTFDHFALCDLSGRVCTQQLNPPVHYTV